MKRKLIWIIPILVIAVLAGVFFIYTEDYCHAERSALASLNSDDTVSVTQTDRGWLFDGPCESDILVFYPGGKVEETAYAPLLHRLAKEGIDVFLVKMPFRLAFFGIGAAEKVMSMYDYERWYIGGHSLGGAMAAYYAAEHGGQLAGVILLAAYPTKALDGIPLMITVCGSEDGVLNMAKLDEGEQYAPENHVTYVIEGGNHAQFGNYGEQRGDGRASVSAEEQQRRTAELIMQYIR